MARAAQGSSREEPPPAEEKRAPAPVPVEGFTSYVRAFGKRALSQSASVGAVAAWGAGALVGGAALTASLTVWARARTKAERSLPPGTHARAAFVAFRALGYATAFTGCATAVCVGGAFALGVTPRRVSALFEAGTQSALHATGADAPSQSKKSLAETPQGQRG